mmetsp:Transcript_5182/g.8531  ORF Transcript_5182/g.8531 Transcript_5182/m.8531 type:complete len:1142 (-) Transcript_5182:178-3603(-)|eukprot:CAMPEP_0114414886 /NCGR_PEP_ID=MMETSP0103-20121206/1624_1 /TAXON_ID=37642 ORGANISM="Paraphysomonas imperforata, Strain PA2" /NCGR_SAMPLE_ID=MMETSP0103 /ASSEMBLY_ACC=CAM_ASM_000201 /LENGTH=1141 /DNA_ID=CAMNT_0001583051 /DNA_START=100 /DNA_END=3525 /DNA_ORIENTATION=-
MADDDIINEMKTKDVEVRETTQTTTELISTNAIQREVSSDEPPRRRSGVQNLLDFMKRYNFTRSDQKRKAVMDLSRTVNAADIARLENQVRTQNRNVTKDIIFMVIKKIRYLLAFCIWILIGAVFYSLHDNMGWALGVYQSLNIGFSLGWALPPRAIPNHSHSSAGLIISKTFTMFHNVIGVLFSGLAVIYIANDLLHRKKNWTVQRELRKRIEETTSFNWFWGNVMGCTTYHLPKIRVFIVFFIVAAGGTLWCFFSFKQHPEWKFPYACVFSFSTLSSAGYRTIPDSSEPYQFVICAIYAAIGVPLMTISLGLFIGRLFFNHDEVTLFEQMAEDVTPKEIETMKLFCNKYDVLEEEHGHQIDNLEFAILIALRIGAVAPEMIERIKERFDILDRNHEHRLAYEDILVDGKGGIASKPQYERTNSFLKSSFSLRQLIALKGSSTGAPSNEHALINGGKNKVHPDIVTPRPRGLSFESNGVALCRLRSSSEDGVPDFIQSRVRTESGDEIFSAWVKASPVIGENGKQRNSFTGRGSEEEEPNYGMRGRGQSDASELDIECPPRRSLRHSFTLTDEEAMQLTKRDSGVKWTRSSPRSSLRKSQVLTEEEAVDFSASHGEEILWIRQSPTKSQLNDNEVLCSDDVRQFSSASRISDPRDASAVVARRRPSKTRRPSIALTLNPTRPVELDKSADDEFRNDIEVGRPSRHVTVLSRASTRQRQHGTPTSGRSTILDVAKGRVTLLGFLDEKTSNRRLGFHERSEQNNIEKMEKARLHHVRSLSRKDSVVDEVWFYASGILYDPHVQFLVLWLIWLSCGAAIFIITYRTKGEENYVSRGMYEAINVGYGLYLTIPEFGESGYVFTIFHLMIGSVMISGAMAEFASYLNKVNDTDNLKAINISTPVNHAVNNKVEVEECEEEEGNEAIQQHDSPRKTWSVDKRAILSVIYRFWLNYPFHVLFSIWLLIMTLVISLEHNWTFFDSLCFSTSVLSTGGFISLPENASTEDYFIVAAFAFVGVPLMALSLGMFTHSISRYGEQSALVELINAGISPEELSEMEDLEILDDDGHFDISEYIILILLRIGALKPDLIKLTNIRFDQLQHLQQSDFMQEQGKGISIHTLRRETLMNHTEQQKKFVSEAATIAE